MCAYRKAILTIGMQLHAMSLHNASRVLFLFLLASAQYTPGL